MRLEKLSIENYRGIGQFGADFEDTRPVVFVGENGSGKSSVLNAVALGLAQITSQLRPKLQQSDGPFGFLFSLPGTEIPQDDVKNGKPHARISWAAMFDGMPVNWSSDTSGGFGLYNHQSNIVMLQPIVDKLWIKLEKLDSLLPILMHYQTNRRVLEVPVDTPDIDYNPSRFDTYDGIVGDTSADFTGFLRWFRFREDVENETRIERSDYRDVQLEVVRRAIASFLPNYSGFRVKRLPPRLVLAKSQIDSRLELPFTQLSDGEKLLVTLVGDIARRLAIANPDSSDPLKETGVVVIDEIELHLHPRWQRMIVPGLIRTFPNIQFFISTHSPQVLSEIESAYVYLLEPSSDADEGTKFTLLDHLYGLDSNRILEDFMGVPERPERIKNELLDLFRTIDAGDLKAARAKREHLATVIAPDEPEFAKADVLMRRLEVRGK